MGQVRDMNHRIQKARSYLWDIVRRARDFIYRLGLPVAGVAVERLLKPFSIVPTIVSFLYVTFILFILICCLERLRRKAWP
jgi:hypothetical protein